MSNAYAIAAAAAALQRLLLAGFAALKVDDLLGGETAAVRCIAPDKLDPNLPGSALDLVLYNQTRNTGWANNLLPSRDARGERTANPPLALDLHYLLCAWGGSDFQAEILLGAAMQVLHETPGLGRQAIRDLLKPSAAKPDLPKELALAGLADQFEQIKITPLNHGTDELSRIWAALQVPARPAAAYSLSLVLIESARSTRTPLPVTRRNLDATPLRAPRIDRVEALPGPGTPVLFSSRLRVAGAQLRATDTRVAVSSIDASATVSSLAADQIEFGLALPLPPPAGPLQPLAGLRAGVNTVQVQQALALGTPPQPHAGFESNLVAFVLDPVATFVVEPGAVATVLGGVTYRSGTVTATCVPRIATAQRVVLLLNEAVPPADRPARAYSFAAATGNGVVAPAEDTANVSIAYQGVVQGDYLARLRVDAGTSPLTSGADGSFDGPLVAP